MEMKEEEEEVGVGVVVEMGLWLLVKASLLRSEEEKEEVKKK